LTKGVRVANARLKVVLFSASCGVPVRVAKKGVTGEVLVRVPKKGLRGAEAGENGFCRRIHLAGNVRAGEARNMKNGSTDYDYCQGISTKVLPFELRRRKSRDWKQLAGIL
jgi:hypothetical protein